MTTLHTYRARNSTAKRFANPEHKQLEISSYFYTKIVRWEVLSSVVRTYSKGEIFKEILKYSLSKAKHCYDTHYEIKEFQFQLKKKTLKKTVR